MFVCFLCLFSGSQIHNFQMEPNPKKLKSLCEAVTTQSPGKSHHMHSTPTDIKNTVVGQRQQNDSSDHDFPDHCSEIIDLTSIVPNKSFKLESRDKLPEDLEFRFPDIDEADTVLWNPEEDLVRADGDDTVVITLNYVNSEDLTQVRPWTVVVDVVYVSVTKYGNLFILKFNNLHSSDFKKADHAFLLGQNLSMYVIFCNIILLDLKRNNLQYCETLARFLLIRIHLLFV